MKKQLDTNEPDKYIHCIWYYWTGARLEIREIDIIKELSKQYSLNKIPAIFVYTNIIGPKQAKTAEKYIKQYLNLDNYIIPVLAKKTIVGTDEGKNTIKIKPFNLDKFTNI